MEISVEVTSDDAENGSGVSRRRRHSFSHDEVPTKRPRLSLEVAEVIRWVTKWMPSTYFVRRLNFNNHRKMLPITEINLEYSDSEEIALGLTAEST